MKYLIALLMVSLVATQSCIGEQSPSTKSSISALQDWRTDESAISAGTGMRLFGGLFLCLGVLGAGVFVVRRFGVGGARISSSSRLRVIERAGLSARSSVALIAVDGRDFLVASSGDSVAIQPIEKQEANSDVLFKDLEELCENSAL